LEFQKALFVEIDCCK